MLFGIQAVTFLKGTLYYCDTTYVPERYINLIKNQWDCFNYGGEWVNHDDNFDNVMNAMVTLFGMMTTEGWLDVMFATVDSQGIDLAPELNLNPGYILFFSCFMIFGSLFIINLFVGVVINTFNIQKEMLSHHNLLTKLQHEYCEVLIKCYSLNPKMKIIETGNKIRDFCSNIVQHPAFEVFIFACICLNTIVLAMSWYNMNE